MRKLLVVCVSLLAALSLCSCSAFFVETGESEGTRGTQNAGSAPADNESKTTKEGTTKQTEKATEAPKKAGTRQSPLKIGQTAIYDGLEESLFYAFKIELSVTGVVRGAEAAKLVKEGNRFNKAAPEGKEYLLVKFKVKALESKDDAKVSVNNSMFGFVSEKGVKYEDFTVVSGVKPAFSDMYAGAESEGYAYQIVDSGDNVSIVFHEMYGGGIWFATK